MYDLPELRRAELDTQACTRLLAEIAVRAQVLEVRARRGAGQSSDVLDLEGARRGLESGELRGVQIVYVWESATWVDTVLAGPGGFRVTRMRASP